MKCSYEIMTSLQYKVKSLTAALNSFQSGEKYVKMQKEHQTEVAYLMQRNKECYCSQVSLNEKSRWYKLILVKTIGFLYLKNLGHSVKYIKLFFLAHHNKHAHALAEIIDALLTPK